MTFRSIGLGRTPGRVAEAPALLRCLLLGVAAAAVMAIASPASARVKLEQPATTVAPVTVNDPFEGVNRRFYSFNRKIDNAILRPAALGYQKVMPRPLRRGLHNLIANLGEPLVFINDLLQLKIGHAAKTAVRFAANSTVGLGGMVDAATSAGLAHHDNDFGATLARYGVPSGPYVFLPLLGPSTVRDLVGSGVDLAANPVKIPKFEGLGAVKATTILVGGLDERANAESDLEAIDTMGTDSYATMRSLYVQNRTAELGGGSVNIESLPQFDDPTAAAAPVDVAVADPAAPPADPTAKPVATSAMAVTPVTLVASAPNTR